MGYSRKWEVGGGWRSGTKWVGSLQLYVIRVVPVCQLRVDTGGRNRVIGAGALGVDGVGFLGVGLLEEMVCRVLPPGAVT